MEAEIIALQLPLVVQHALLAMGSSIAVACVDGPSPAGKIAGVLIAAGAITILASNWHVVEPQWGHITQAFQKAFDAAAASIVQAFNDIKIKASKKSAERDAKPKEKHEKFKGKPGEVKTDGKDQIKIGDDGRAVRVRHHGDHGHPKYHSNPHDHDITWTLEGNPDFGKPINYPNGAPPFK